VPHLRLWAAPRRPGNADYITIEHLEKAARADDMRLDEAVKNLAETVEIAKKEPNHLHR
jgi:hypothetical protein